MLSSEKHATPSISPFRLPKETIGDLDAETAARLMAASSDVAMVIDRDGIIRDVAVSCADLPFEGFGDIIERRWVDTVTSESRRKVEEMLQDAGHQQACRWREVNQQSPKGAIPFRYLALDAGRDGRVIALGRDLRGVEQLQQRVLQAQQAMERDYARLRQAESRYRVLFQIASEAVLIVDQATKTIIEANPAAGNLLGVEYGSLADKPFAKLFHADSRDAAMALLLDYSASTQAEPVPIRLANGRADCTATASLFRQQGATQVLVSLAVARADQPANGDDGQIKLLRVLNRIPDAFVLTDQTLTIREVNLAFLELAQVASAEGAKGQPLARFLGRPGVDFKVLIDNLADHGWVRNFSTIVRSAYGDQEDVELSGVSVHEGLEVTHGFVIRPTRRLAAVPSPQSRQLPRTAEQLTQLVGRVSLREIVAETTDVIERMCIEAALNLTGNNRASAAEVLGLSRQSLYSKMTRHGVGAPDSDTSSGH
jgi:transcriptional regulator PpsR